MRFECEMSGVEEDDLRAGIVALEGFGPGREKERIGLAPDGEGRRPRVERRLRFLRLSPTG